ncbi:MAG: hypothetical protein J0H51_21340, partial [Rhizobiales bacterium]|nr:hypothetical protein [Hyphomicrobiales bacterium]
MPSVDLFPPRKVHRERRMILPGLDGFSFTAIAVLTVTAFVAGLARGFSGFGSALIFMPLASAAIGAQIASPLLLIIEMIAAA